MSTSTPDPADSAGSPDAATDAAANQPPAATDVTTIPVRSDDKPPPEGVAPTDGAKEEFLAPAALEVAPEDGVVASDSQAHAEGGSPPAAVGAALGIEPVPPLAAPVAGD